MTSPENYTHKTQYLYSNNVHGSYKNKCYAKNIVEARSNLLWAVIIATYIQLIG